MNKKLSVGIGIGGSVLLLRLAAAQSVPADSPVLDKTVSVDAQPYTEPAPIRIRRPIYPESERYNEGWVEVQMMIDPQGKPYEIELVSSTGTKAFESSALKAVAESRFKPATLDGRPVDAAFVLPMFFLSEFGGRANAKFIESYQALAKAVDVKDKAAADEALKMLMARNFFEMAYLSWAQYLYAQQWGSEPEQIAGLRRAINWSTKPAYLTKSQFNFALQRLFTLEVRTMDYASALSTYKTLVKQKLDAKVLANFKPIAEQIESLRTAPRSYSVPGRMDSGTWPYRLFKNKFSFKVKNGRISQIKLYCQKKYVLIPFDATLEYTIEKGFGECSMVVFGDAETEFDLIQS